MNDNNNADKTEKARKNKNAMPCVYLLAVVSVLLQKLLVSFPDA